jgi:predicted ATPase
MNYLEKLSIKGFKAFTEETSIDFKKLTVLAGANSVGKSSVIQAILLGKMAIDKGLSVGYGVDEPILAKKIPLNGDYNLSLGTTRQITSTDRISLDFAFIKDYFNLYLDVPIDKTYLENSVESVLFGGSNILFGDFYYLSAERIGPRALYDESLSLKFIGYQGEYAMQMLVEGLTFDVSPELNFHTVTKTSGASTDNLFDQTNLWMQYIIPGIKLSADRLRDLNKSVASVNKHTMPNVGFGISYVLPIVVAGLIAKDLSILKDLSLFIIENPEAHLHPSGQTRIGEFFAAVAAQEGVQVIIETHSEHVINGIRVAALKDYIKPSDILVNFLHRDEKKDRKIQIRPIEIKDNGEFSSFPPGFFDQHAQNLIEMTKYRMKKK